jgi:hypothetical protein
MRRLRWAGWPTYAWGLAFGLAFALGYVLLREALMGALAVLCLLECFTGYLLVKQRRLIALQQRQVMDVIALSNDMVTRFACSEWNLQRACTELERAGIEFHPLVPPTAAVDKETMT